MKATIFFARLTTAVLALTFSSTLLGAAVQDVKNANPQQVFDEMRQSFHRDKAKGVHARYQWELSGPDGGQWWVEVHDGTLKMGRGRLNNPDVTFRVSDKDWVALSNGRLSGVWAYFTGRLKIRGDRNLARKLGEMFP